MALATPRDTTSEIFKIARHSVGALLQLSRYFAASAAALAVDFAIYMMLCALAVNAPVAGIIGYAAGIIVHYVLSSRFVFDISRAHKAAPRRFAEFAVSGLLGLVLTGFIIGVLTEYFAASAIVAKGAAVAMSFLTVFLVRRWIVFGDKGLGTDLVYSKSGTCR